MKKYKSLLLLTLCASLTCSQAVSASAVIPPIPVESAAESTENTGPGASAAGSTGTSAPDSSSGTGTSAPGSSADGGTTGSGDSAGPGASQTGSASGQTESVGPGASVSGSQSGAGAGTVVSTVEALQIQSEGAALLDASTGKLLYGKNENTQFYPASITKMMTALLVAENCSLDEVVTFSETATTNLESGAVTLSLTAGDQLTVEDCLYALLLKSANEVANGLAEHVAGSVENFAAMMNARAKELGCQNTNFVNPNGLNKENHKTTP